MIDILPLTIVLYDDVFRLWKRCDGVGLSNADSRDGIRAYLQRNPNMSFVAASDGKLVGTILAGHDGRRGYIHHLAVLPNYRRQGIAGKLVDRSMGILSDQGIDKCHLFIFNDNTDGIAFWKAVGWTWRHDINVMSKFIGMDAGH